MQATTESVQRWLCLDREESFARVTLLPMTSGGLALSGAISLLLAVSCEYSYIYWPGCCVKRSYIILRHLFATASS
jgi:hypothetical protein